MVYALGPEHKIEGKSIAGFQPTNDDYLQIEVEDPTPDGGLFMDGGDTLTSGRRIKPDHVPRQMKLDGGTVIADYTSYNGFLCVTDKFKNVVEAVEPGVHQFIPFEAVGTGKKHLANLWIMVVCNRLDSVDRDHTTLILYRNHMWIPAQDVPSEHWPSSYDPSKPVKLVHNLSKIGDHHLWYDKHIGYQKRPLASNELVEALKISGVTGVSFHEREAV
jgi:hypothetical protein